MKGITIYLTCLVSMIIFIKLILFVEHSTTLGVLFS